MSDTTKTQEKTELPSAAATGSAVQRNAHTLKTWPQFLDAIGEGRKTFECRKNDRGFRVGDILHLLEYYPDRREYGPRSITCFVSYILEDERFGLHPGWCVMGLRMPANHQWPPNTEVSGAGR